MHIGPYLIDPPIGLAPMAGVTDKPFRQLCKRLGAGLATTEMTTSDPRLWGTRKSLQRMDHAGEPDPVSVQIAGYDPGMLADAARYNADLGAQIIDINMGCPAKKVCNVYSGSALMQDEALVARILPAVVAAVDVPVTLKIRTGWNRDNKNGLRIAHIAQESGIAALAVHGRTRADLYNGQCEYDTIAAIKQEVRIPVFANGDIDTPQKARDVLDYTKCDGLLIGRAAQGRPWIFRQIAHYLATGEVLADPAPEAARDILVGHLRHLHEFYGEHQGVRIARKHLGWYFKANDKYSFENRAACVQQGAVCGTARLDVAEFRHIAVRTESASEQLRLTRDYFAQLADTLALAA
ncbi:MAG TPA: tRNA dihydrouridine synthase DusB [Rudaea sp.]|nr:tRNA dihydrouridine synthase DusB [Rudaea sp.]